MTIQLRRDTYSNWSASNPVIPDGQATYDKTNKELRVGDGSSSWLSLPAIGTGGGSDHGGLSGLTDDDHLQYHNDVRGDARYLRKLNNVVVINSESDFPIQDATTITLSEGKAYIMGALVTTAKRFIVEANVTIRSLSILDFTLLYTGTGTMFTVTGGGFSVENLIFGCPNGTVYNFNSSGLFLMQSSICTSCANIGSVTGVGAQTIIDWTNLAFGNVTGQGLQISGTLTTTSLTKIITYSTSPTFINYDLGTSVSNNIEMDNLEGYGVAGSIGLKGLANSGNVLAGKVASVTNSNLAGNMMTPVSTILSTDVRWDFQSNAGIEDTMDDALLYFSGNATNTIIVAISTDGSNAVKVAGTWIAGRLSKFTADAAGRVTSLSERAVTVPIDVSILIKSVGGGAARVAVYLAKNGVIIAAATTSADVSGSTSKNISFPWQETLTNGQYLEVFVENQTNTNDLLVENAIFRIR